MPETSHEPLQELFRPVDHAAVGLVALAAEVQYRSEHSRSIEDAERYKAVETLKELGLIQHVADRQLYHGQVEAAGSDTRWKVDKHFKNGHNDNGNFNVNSVPSLYTGEKSVAHEFAMARHRQIAGDTGKRQFVPRVYRVTSSDSDAGILDTNFMSSDLSAAQKERMHKAIVQLLPPITEGAPGEFGDSPKVREIIDEINRGTEIRREGDLPLGLDMAFVEKVASKLGISESMATHFVGAANARMMLQFDVRGVSQLVLKHHDKSIVEHGPVPGMDVPISIEYIGRFLKNAHIIGFEQTVSSATIRRTVDIVSLLDLARANTPGEYRRKRHSDGEMFDAVTAVFGGRQKAVSQELWAVLQNAHATPRSQVEAAMKVPGFRNNFDADGGNWEGYTVAEHTETALRNFEENYADTMPVGIQSIVRLALIGHDIGKGVAAAHGRKAEQHHFNERHASSFYEAIGLDKSSANFLKSLIGTGAELASKSAVFGDDRQLGELREHAFNQLGSFLGRVPAEGEIDGYIELCEAIVTCDGGAYTTMALTRTSHNGLRRNAGSFNSSFKEPTGPGKRDLELKNGHIAARSRKL